MPVFAVGHVLSFTIQHPEGPSTADPPSMWWDADIWLDARDLFGRGPLRFVVDDVVEAPVALEFSIHCSTKPRREKCQMVREWTDFGTDHCYLEGASSVPMQAPATDCRLVALGVAAAGRIASDSRSSAFVAARELCPTCDDSALHSRCLAGIDTKHIIFGIEFKQVIFGFCKCGVFRLDRVGGWVVWACWAGVFGCEEARSKKTRLKNRLKLADDEVRS